MIAVMTAFVQLSTTGVIQFPLGWVTPFCSNLCLPGALQLGAMPATMDAMSSFGLFSWDWLACSFACMHQWFEWGCAVKNRHMFVHIYIYICIFLFMLLSAYTPQDDTWEVETARANEDRRIWKVAACPLGLCISVLFCMPYHPWAVITAVFCRTIRFW